MSAAAVRVLIADDHRMFRQGIAAICRGRGGFEVVGQAADGRQAVDLALALRPDVVVMDIRMPELDGIRATADLLEAWPQARVLMLTMHSDERNVLEAIKAGARGYMFKQAGADELMEAIRMVHRGEALVDPALALRALDELRRGPSDETSPAPAYEALSEAEMAVLVRVARGMDNAEIAAEMGIATSTVGNRLSQIYLKLRVANRTQAALEALRRGWASLDESV